jgi:DNA-binding MarR family transcriptional regulator/GNAT superfamily N-acetyltransferase
MERELIGAVRQFNRTVTHRIGALDEQYLARSRPLGASRVLWEIADTGTDARTLRSRLELDSGYLSRLLRKLEAEELITVTQDPFDQRVRVVRLTPAGRAERAVLDDLSDELASSILEPLDDERRAALVAAMRTVDRLLTASSVVVDVEDPTTADALFCLRSYFAELGNRFDAGFDPDRGISATADELVEPAGLFLVARLRGEPIGCGALKFHDDAPAELKRMWVSATARGLGVGRRMLRELEQEAFFRGVTTVHLETNRNLTEAIALYRTAGYREVAAFNDEPYAHHWFEKHLSTPNH